MLVGRRVLRALKDGTADLHEEAERYVRILDGDATLDDYRRYLATMAGFHVPLEAVLASHHDLASLGFDAHARRKSHLLARDLASLGAPAWALCSALPDASNLSRAIGIAYVIEGSTLGGRYVLSRLPPAIEAVRATATAFLAGYGEATGQRWRAFGEVIERGVISADDERDAVAGARDCFTCLNHWLAAHEFRASTPARVLA